MQRLSFSFPRAYRLVPVRGTADDFVSELRIGTAAPGRTVLLPYSGGLGYFVAPTGRTDVSIATADFRVEKLSLPLSLWVRMRLALLFRRRKYLRFEDFSLFSAGARPERRRFTRFNRQMSNIGLALDGGFITSHPELLVGWQAEDGAERPRRVSGGPNSVGIVVHIFYEDTWTEIAEVLKRQSIPFDLVVTTVPGRDRLTEAIRRDFPDADIRVMENRGRDVRPFLELLEEGRLDRYRYVCKIHGKRSDDGGREAFVGSIWRRRLLYDLLAGPDVAEKVLAEFEGDAMTGMVGSAAFRLPSRSVALDPWGENRSKVLDLVAKMGIAPEDFRLDFFGGTMFWVRPEALRPLRELKLAATFPEEKGLLDGGLEHVTERLFGAAVIAAGYRLANSGERTFSERE